jgi:rubrerythrin
MSAERSKLATPGEILHAALVKERAAYTFYARMENGSTVGFVRDLAMKLKNEEAKHVRMIEEQITLMNLGRA